MGRVSIIIVNLNGRKFLEKLLQSIFAQSYKNLEITFVDNNSSDRSVEEVRAMAERHWYFKNKLKIITLGENHGFAEGNNIGVCQSSGEYILFLNNDALLEKDAVKNLVSVIKDNPLIAGVAPKTYLSRFLPLRIFDSIGTCMASTGSPYNRGIGQVDLGQYDQEEEIFGLCFAAALVRKKVFDLAGGLDGSYFAYFEDVDWSFRVRKMGFRFLTCPKAIVYHLHSGTSSKKSYEWKYYLIFRNFLRTIVKDFGKKNVIRKTRIRLRDMVNHFLRGSDYQRKKTLIKLLVNFSLKDFWYYFLKRFSARKHFINEITDEYLFSYARHEPSIFFDPVKYKPLINFKMLDFIFYRVNYFCPFPHSSVEKWERIKQSAYLYRNKLWQDDFKKFLRSNFSKYLTKSQREIITTKIHQSLKGKAKPQ